MHAVVLGVGFEAMYAAHILKSSGYNVDMIGTGKSVFGGVMSGISYNGFDLDFGCQVFDNFDSGVTQAIQTWSDNTCHGLDISYGSRFCGTMSYDVSVPDLSSLPEECRRKMISEMKSAVANVREPSTLREYFEYRWGRLAADYLDKISQKFYGLPSEEIDKNAHIYCGLKRVRIAEDQAALSLKKSDARIDAVLAVPRSRAGNIYSQARLKYPFWNLYPKGGFADFCKKAYKYLEKNGVRISVNNTVEYIKPGKPLEVCIFDNEKKKRKVFLCDVAVCEGSVRQTERTLLGRQTLQSLMRPLGMNLSYYFVKKDVVSDIGYVQNFDNDLSFFRWSSAGLFANKLKNGKTFICIETPAYEKLNSDRHFVEKQWEEVRGLGLVSGQCPQQTHHVYAYNCFNVYKKGFSEAATNITRCIQECYPNVVHVDPGTFGRIPAALEISHKLKGFL